MPATLPNVHQRIDFAHERALIGQPLGYLLEGILLTGIAIGAQIYRAEGPLAERVVPVHIVARFERCRRRRLAQHLHRLMTTEVEPVAAISALTCAGVAG